MNSDNTSIALQLEMRNLDTTILIARCDELLSLHQLIDADREWDVFEHILNRAYDRSKFDPALSYVLHVAPRPASAETSPNIGPLAAFLIANRESIDGLKRYANRSVYISKGAVHPLLRRQGLFARIMHAALWAANQLVPGDVPDTTPVAFWKTTFRSHAAIHLYESIGSTNVVPPGVDAGLKNYIEYDADDNERFTRWSQGHRVFEVSKKEVNSVLEALNSYSS